MSVEIKRKIELGRKRNYDAIATLASANIKKGSQAVETLQRCPNLRKGTGTLKDCFNCTGYKFLPNEAV